MRGKFAPEPKEGTDRARKEFLFFPKCIRREWRWLETAAWKESYRWTFLIKSPWCPIVWIDNLEQVAPERWCPDCGGLVWPDDRPGEPPVRCLGCGRRWSLNADVRELLER